MSCGSRLVFFGKQAPARMDVSRFRDCGTHRIEMVFDTQRIAFQSVDRGLGYAVLLRYWHRQVSRFCVRFFYFRPSQIVSRIRNKSLVAVAMCLIARLIYLDRQQNKNAFSPGARVVRCTLCRIARTLQRYGYRHADTLRCKRTSIAPSSAALSWPCRSVCSFV